VLVGERLVIVSQQTDLPADLRLTEGRRTTVADILVIRTRVE
jgi:hypothetical protein